MVNDRAWGMVKTAGRDFTSWPVLADFIEDGLCPQLADPRIVELLRGEKRLSYVEAKSFCHEMDPVMGQPEFSHCAASISLLEMGLVLSRFTSASEAGPTTIGELDDFCNPIETGVYNHEKISMVLITSHLFFSWEKFFPIEPAWQGQGIKVDWPDEVPRLLPVIFYLAGACSPYWRQFFGGIRGW